MSYTVNGKLYTENPMVDEIVYNIKIMLDGIVLKDTDLANSYETKESIHDGELYVAIKNNNNINFNTFVYDEDILSELDLPKELIHKYSIDNELIPLKYRDKLCSIAKQLFLDNYIEYNNYYRWLNGLPRYNYPYIYLTLDNLYNIDSYIFDLSKPLHEYTNYQIKILEDNGILTKLQNDYPDELYLWHLGDKRIDFFTSRKASMFELLYIPKAEIRVMDRFKEILESNRVIYTKRHYSQAYKFNSDYYDRFMTLMIIAQSVTDLIVEIPEWYIRRDVFDERTVRYILESNGCKYFKKIPLRYQLNIVKKLNRLIKYKSTTKNLYDIISCFNLDNATIYKYFIIKNRLKDNNGEFITEKEYVFDSDDQSYIEKYDDDKMYELFFVKTPVGKLLDDYICDGINKVSYESITNDDKYWDGIENHEYILSDIINKKFSVQNTKYLSLETIYESKKYLFQIQYFLNLLITSGLDTTSLYINIPIINNNSSFTLMDIFILLNALSSKYYNIDMPDNININTDSFIASDYMPPYNSKYEYEDLHKWFRDETRSSLKKLPYIDTSKRINGFNMNADLNYLSEIISQYHPHFGWKHGFTLETAGVSDYIIPENKTINTVNELINVYKNCKSAFDTLSDNMINCDTKDDYEIYEFIYNYLFTTEMDLDIFKSNDGNIFTTYSEILKYRNHALYSYYKDIVDNDDIEAKQYNMDKVISTIIDSIKEFLNTNLLDYLYYFLPTEHWSSTLQYISLLIDFFKSYKTQFLDMYGTLVFNYEFDNTCIIKDKLDDKKIEESKVESINTREYMDITKIYEKYEDDITDDRYINIRQYHHKYYNIDGGDHIPTNRYLDYYGNNEDTDTIDAGNPNEIMKNAVTNLIDYLDGGKYRTKVEEYNDIIDGGESFNEYEYYSVIDDDGGGAEDINAYSDYTPDHLFLNEDIDGGNASFTSRYVYDCNGGDNLSTDYNDVYTRNLLDEYLESQAYLQLHKTGIIGKCVLGGMIINNAELDSDNVDPKELYKQELEKIKKCTLGNIKLGFSIVGFKGED